MPKRKKIKKSQESAAADQDQEELPLPLQSPDAMIQEPQFPSHLDPPPSQPEAAAAGCGGGGGGGEQEEPQETVASPPTNPPPSSRKPAGKRKKPISTKKLAAIQEKLSLLTQNLRPIPFSPSKTLTSTISLHEPLFRSLGLWDFAQLPLDLPIRPDLLALLLAHYDQPARRSSVNGVRISVSRADLARALSLPVKKDKELKDKEFSDLDLLSGEEAAAVIGDFIYGWMVLLEDTSILPPEAVLANQLVKEGQPHKVDWAGLMWTMVEREIFAAPLSGQCYYASHLQCLIKHQKPKLFEVEAALEPEPLPELELEAEPSMEVSLAEEEEDATRTRSLEDFRDVGCDKHGPGLSLGLGGDADAMVGIEQNNGGEDEQLVSDGKDVGIEHCLRRCNLNEVVGRMECEDLGKGEEDMEGREEDRFDAKFSSLDRITSSDLLQAMETDNNVSFNPSLHPTLDPSSAEFLVMGTESQKNMTLDPGPDGSLFCGNNCKRELEEIDDGDDDCEDVHGLPQSNQQKRLRSDGAWEQTPLISAFDGCMEEVQCWMGKAKMTLVEKDQAYMNAQLQLQYMSGLLQQKEHIIQSMEKERMEEMQKRQLELCRFEHELGALSSVVFGYKKALKETRNVFAEYRKKFPLGNKPLYTDVGADGGVVLGARELGKQCLGKEEEEMRCIAVGMITDFRKSWLEKFTNYTIWVNKSAAKVVELRDEVRILKERFVKTRDQETMIE